MESSQIRHTLTQQLVQVERSSIYRAESHGGATRAHATRKDFGSHFVQTGSRLFLNVEFDFDGGRCPEEARVIAKLEKQGRDVRDLCAALLLHLAEKAPLALAVYSGGKSLHGWFHCAGIADERVLRFFRYAVSLGADPANWNRSQFARMPDGLRDNGRRQTVYFFNPRVVK